MLRKKPFLLFPILNFLDQAASLASPLMPPAITEAKKPSPNKETWYLGGKFSFKLCQRILRFLHSTGTRLQEGATCLY